MVELLYEFKTRREVKNGTTYGTLILPLEMLIIMVHYLTDGFWIKNTSWYARLFKDPAFVAKVKERFNYFYGKREDIMREINANAEYLKYAVQENEKKWHTFYTYTWPNYDIWGSYNNEVQSMKEWLNARFEWLKGEFDKM